MEEASNVKFRLVSIDNEKLVSNIDDFDLDSLADDKLRFQYKTDTVIKLSRNIIEVTPCARYSYEGRPLFQASVSFVFTADNLDSVVSVDKENRRVVVRADIFPSLVGAAYNSLRGIVFARMSSTGLAKYPLPLIDVQTLTRKNGISVEDL